MQTSQRHKRDNIWIIQDTYITEHPNNNGDDDDGDDDNDNNVNYDDGDIDDDDNDDNYDDDNAKQTWYYLRGEWQERC
jgi:hypothetical protein